MIDVLIVDDSAFMRKVLSDILSGDDELNVLDTASNGEEAIIKTSLLNPDVITMDVEMPEMDGINSVKRIMQENPTPIIMVSAHTRKGARKTIQALEAGAVDFIEKPGGTISLKIREVRNELIEKIKIASQANLKIAERDVELKYTGKKSDINTVVIIAASTGGPRVISYILSNLPKDFLSSILVVQHMPGGFTKAFAKRLNEHSPLKVKEAEEGDLLNSGEVLVAPGGYHMEFEENYRVTLNIKPPLHGVRPSADITMNSIAEIFNGRIIAVILTGMGEDGSIGIKHIKSKGGNIIVQDRNSAIVYGMPGAAIKTGFVDEVLSADKIVPRIVELCNV